MHVASAVPTPNTVPMPPMMTPSSMKMRMIAPSLAPSALRMAISLPFSVTIRSSVQMMQKLATAIAMREDDERRDLLELERAEEVLVHLHPVADAELGASCRGVCRIVGERPRRPLGESSDLLWIGHRMSMSVILSSRLKKFWATSIITYACVASYSYMPL